MRRRGALIIPAVLAVLAGLVMPASADTGPAAASTSTESLATTPVQETATGTARTLDFPGGGYVVVHSSGNVSMVGGDGQTAWQLGTQDLYQDWDLTWQQPGFTQTPQLDWGTDPADPLEFSGEAPGLIDDVNPVAVGDIGGQDDVAVAETVGAYIAAGYAESICPWCTWPFDVPGSDLHIGTFVSVLDGHTGRMLYHELVPGYVTQLAVADGRLIVGEENGDPQQNPATFGTWGAVSTVSALTINPNGTATQAWQYSTKSQWGRLLDMTVTGGSQPGVALAWSDTPLDLGVPSPPHGHLLLLNAATGGIDWQIRTAGYPVLIAADDQLGELAVVGQSDPSESLEYTLSGVRYTDGSVAMSTSRTGSLPMSLAVGHGAQDGWAVGAVDATTQSDGYTPTDGRVTLTDPTTGTQLWSSVLPDTTSSGPPLPGGLVVTGQTVVAGSWLGGTIPSAASPLQNLDSMTALNYRTGKAAWSQYGDPGDPMSLSPVADGSGSVRAVNSHQEVEIYGVSGSVTPSTAAGPGDYTSATTASIAAPGSTDLVTGDEDGDVTALDGRALSTGKDQVLWQAHLPGPVQDLVHAQLDGRPVLVAAATTAIGVLDASTGRVLKLIGTPGTYAYTATVISADGTPAVVVPGTALTAYSLATGSKLWSHAAPAGASFSDAAYSDGVVAAEYSSAVSDTGTPATEMAAVGLNAATGKLSWSHAADPTDVQTGDLWNGAFASPYIAGAGGDGVAFAWAESTGWGKVDVRNIATGALLYSDSSPNLSELAQLTASPALGLIGVSTQGAAQLTPSGAVGTDSVFGESAAMATDAAGDTALVTGDVSVQAYGTDIFTDASASVAGTDDTYETGQLVAGDFAGNGTQQVVAIPADWLAYQVVEGETGYLVPPDPLALQHGLAVVTLTDSGTTAAAVRQQSTTQGTNAPQERYPAAQTPKTGATTTSAVPAYLRPVGQVGSVTPTPEPQRSGALQPNTSSTTARHTVSSTGTTATPPPGYSPAQMTAHLGLTGNGTGQTIAIVDAYDDPDIASDAETFSEQYGLPGVCGAGGTAGNCFTLDVRQQSASAANDPGWALETSLDVEWAHALAPHATIELVEASDATFASMFQAVTTASAGHPAAVSMSWGMPGEFSDETYYDHFCALTTSVCVVASGDEGFPSQYPAYNPSVLAIGGTTQTLADDGSVTSEQAWSGSGGGQSWVESEPAYQDSVQSSGSRQVPDVSFDADPNTGVAIYDSIPYTGQQGWWIIGGTSLGAPAWSGILADTDQLRAAAGKKSLTAAGFAAQRAVYALPSTVIAPITTGPANGFCPVGCTPIAGYDSITGLGSPRAGIDAALAQSQN